jgi:hypothetical protein
MNQTNISKILTTFFAVVLCLGPVGLAEPIGTAFTYQGRLIDANQVADGLYDFQFKLYDANSAGNKLGQDVNKPEVDVIDGYFTVELDFGSVFDGNNRWLGIGVRPGVQSDPNIYTTLSPRQKITPTPYALYALNGGGAGGGSPWLVNGGDIYYNNGNVGIGTTTPNARLHVQGQIKITGGLPDTGKVLTCDASGLATWQTPVGAPDGDWIMSAGNMFSGVSGNVGIGTTTPGEKLAVYSSDSDAIRGNTSSGPGKAVYGVASNTSNYTNYGGYFTAAGGYGMGVYGLANNSNDGTGNVGGYFETLGGGMGVFGRASKTGDNASFGGYFDAAGNQARGVYGMAYGNSGYGVYGEASNTGAYSNFGGYFKAAGAYAYGVYGEATNNDASSNSYGGYFTTAGTIGIAVFGGATNLSGSSVNYGGYFNASGGTGSTGVLGNASNNGNYTNYGGNFSASGSTGRGVQATAMNTGSYINYGGWFQAGGAYGRGVYGEASNSGDYGNYGGMFKAAGASGSGIYGYATHTSGTNYGVYARTDSPNGYAGYFWGAKNYFQGNVGIGTTSPARALHVSDVMRLQPRSTAPSSPAEGDIYMDSSSHKLMVYDGTAWQACW